MNAESMRGHLDGLVLAVLERGPRHGYGIIEAMRVRSGGVLDLPTGTVYPALHRLERTKLITSDWATVAGRRRRTYSLTTTGRRALRAERAGWREFTAAVDAVLGATS